MNKTHVLTKKKALAIVLFIGLVLLVLIGLRWYAGRSPSHDLSTLAGRQAFLLELGWEIDPDSEEFRTVVVPEKLEGINLQFAQRKAAKRKLLRWLLILLCAAVVAAFITLLLLHSPYLKWDYAAPETAVIGVTFHALEWLFVRLAPMILAGAIAGILLLHRTV